MNLKGPNSLLFFFFWGKLVDDGYLGDVNGGNYVHGILLRWWEWERFGARIDLKSPTIIGSYSGATSSFLKQHIFSHAGWTNKTSFFEGQMEGVHYRISIIRVVKLNECRGKRRNE